MKKRVTLLVIARLLTYTIPCFAQNSNIVVDNVESIAELEKGQENDSYDITETPMYIARLQQDGKILVQNRVIINDEVVFNEITFHQAPYLKNGNMMIPLKEMIEIENKYRGFLENVIYEIQPKQYSLTFHGNQIIFYEGKRDIIVNNIKMGLYEIPDITENDIFISTQDMDMIFTDRGPFEKESGQWTFKMKLEASKGIYINPKPIEKKSVAMSIEENGDVLLNGKKRKMFSTYVKKNHVMLAVKDIERFLANFEDIKVENIWNGENNTVIMKVWHHMAKDVVFTKDSNKMLVNGVEAEMEEAAEIKENRMYIPITALFEILEISMNNS